MNDVLVIIPIIGARNEEDLPFVMLIQHIEKQSNKGNWTDSELKKTKTVWGIFEMSMWLYYCCRPLRSFWKKKKRFDVLLQILSFRMGLWADFVVKMLSHDWGKHLRGTQMWDGFFSFMGTLEPEKRQISSSSSVHFTMWTTGRECHLHVKNLNWRMDSHP